MSQRAPAFIGFGQYPNVINFASTLVQSDAAYAVPALPASNLQTIEPTEIARILTNLPQFAYWSALLGGGTVSTLRSLSGFALVNVNLSPGGLVRFLGNSLTPPFVEYAPTAIATSNNASGAVTDVDDDLDNPDTIYIEPTDTTKAWSVRFTFPTPVTPRTGEHMGMFALRMVLVDGGNVAALPVATAWLYESGTLIRSLGSRPISVSTGTGQLLYYTFDPAELTAPDCSNVEVLVSCSRGIGTGATYARLDTVALVIDDASLTFPALDSGWLPSPFAQHVEYEGIPGLTTDVDYFPEDLSLWSSTDRFIVMIRDDQTVHDPLVGFGGLGGNYAPASAVVRNPSGHIDAGILVAGPALVLERAPRLAPESRVIVEGFEGVTEGGQSYGTDAFRRRAISVNLTLNRSEKDALLDGIDWRRGQSYPFYVNLEPNLPPQSKGFISGWVTAAEAGPAIQMPDAAYHAGDLMLFTKNYEFHERL